MVETFEGFSSLFFNTLHVTVENHQQSNFHPETLNEEITHW